MKVLNGLASATLVVLFSGATASMHAQQYGPPPGPPPPGAYQAQGGWDGPPNEFNDAQRRGFHDGIDGARKDFDNHRPPNVNNRDEFRHPSVPGPLRHDYRMGFRRGYDTAVQHMSGGPGPGPR